MSRRTCGTRMVELVLTSHSVEGQTRAIPDLPGSPQGRCEPETEPDPEPIVREGAAGRLFFGSVAARMNGADERGPRRGEHVGS